MRTSVPGILNNRCRRSKARGFTLLEVLVVVVIAAIIFSLSTLAIRGTTPEELLQTEARRLDRLLQLAQEEAILRGQEYGLQFRPDSYEFVVYDLTGWQSLTHDRFLRKRELPADMEIELLIEEVEVVIEESRLDTVTETTTDEDGKTVKKEKIKPQVFLLSSGEITPQFSARLVLPGVETSYLVKGAPDGRHEAVIEEF